MSSRTISLLCHFRRREEKIAPFFTIVFLFLLFSPQAMREIRTVAQFFFFSFCCFCSRYMKTKNVSQNLQSRRCTARIILPRFLKGKHNSCCFLSLFPLLPPRSQVTGGPRRTRRTGRRGLQPNQPNPTNSGRCSSRLLCVGNAEGIGGGGHLS